MSFKQRIAILSALLFGCAFLPVSSLAQLSFESQQVAQTDNVTSVIAHGDFNNDGREDFVVSNYSTSNGTVAYQLYLSNGDDSYAAPKTLPAYVNAVGDFNGDGNLDFASFHTGTLSVYLGNGDGVFQSPKTVTTTTPFFIVAADMNHDGKTDLVAFSNGSPSTLQIWISSGDGTFSKGQTISLPDEGAMAGNSMITGDFDGDGNPDIALIRGAGNLSMTTVQVWYGDGAGHLGSPYTTTDPKKYDDEYAFAADLNSDGRSDIITTLNTYDSDGQLVDLPNLAVFTGNGNRTLSYTEIATNECPSSVAVADFNGDGLNDLAFNENTCSPASNDTDFVVRLGEGSDTYGPQQTIYQNSYGPSDIYAVRTTTGTKPDIVFSLTNGVNSSSLDLLTNTSDGDFPGCGPSGFAEGVQICTPSASATSPVKFSVGAAGPTPMRTAAVWADGKKVAEQLTHAFSNYSFLDASVPLAAGKHAITVYGTGWDDTLQQKSFTLTVSSAATCSAPTSAGVHVCQPASSASVSSPVTIQATSTITGKFDRMEVWVDGAKQYTETSGTTLNTTLSVAAGTHRFGIFAVNTEGTKWEGVVDAIAK